jgi:hypothetical protein
MSTYDYIFMATNLEPADVAKRLAESLQLRLVQTSDGGVAIGRPIAEGRVEQVGGEVLPNIYADPSADPDDESLPDGYTVVWQIRYTGGDEDIQLAEARTLFRQMTEKEPWPAVHTHGLDTLVAAWHPGMGLREFPPGVSVYSSDRQIWAPYRQRITTTGEGGPAR